MSRGKNGTASTYVSELQDGGYEKTGINDKFKLFIQGYREQPFSTPIIDEIDGTNQEDEPNARDCDLLSDKLFSTRSWLDPNGQKNLGRTENRYECLKPFAKTNYVHDRVGDYKLTSNLSSFYLGGDQADIRSALYIDKFLVSMKQFAEERKKGDASGLAEEMVSSFQELSKEVVFNSSSRMLSSIPFRTQCPFLSSLLCPDNTPSVQLPRSRNKMSSLYGNVKIFFLDALDPFVCDSLLRISREFSRNKKLFCGEKNDGFVQTLMRELRLSLFVRRAEKEFKRFMYLEHQTYKVHLNRQLNSIVAFPYLHASSLETVKPIRLFEKIQQYIEKRWMDAGNIREPNPKLNVRVCLIGYTEPSKKIVRTEGGNEYEERELFDLAQAVASWLEEKSAINTDFAETEISVSIENLYNECDIPRPLDRKGGKNSIDQSIEIQNRKHTIRAKASAISYDWFNFNTTFFTDVIMENNDLIFLLDCPFLTEEDYDVQRGFSLREYCETLRRWDYFDMESYPRLDEKRHTPMEVLNSQYNRIMASATRNAGEICRVFRDYWVSDINAKLKKDNGVDSVRKVVYIFTSETDGLIYSSLSSHPVSRTEQYEGKTFNIFRLGNKKADMLPPPEKNARMEIKISLWRMLKYASVEYAFNSFRTELEKLLLGTKRFTHPLDIHALYRYIWIELSEEVEYKQNHQYRLALKIGADQVAVKRILERNGLTGEKHSQKLYCFVRDFVEGIYKNVYFPEDNAEKQFGDELLREAFCMNLYGAAENIWSLWFWHTYRTAISQNKYSQFHISYPDHMENSGFTTSIEKSNTDASASDFFKDKKLYDIVFRSLEISSSISPAVKSLLYNVPEFFETYGNHGYETILGNALKMYDMHVAENTTFRENCRLALDDLL